MVTSKFVLLAFLQAMTVTSFSMLSTSKRGRNDARMTYLASTVDDDKALQCFIVNAFEVEEEGATPEIVCTPEPDDYAWFNGLDRESMSPADGKYEDFLECVEGASPRGVPEWECKKKTMDEKSWQ